MSKSREKLEILHSNISLARKCSLGRVKCITAQMPQKEVLFIDAYYVQGLNINYVMPSAYWSFEEGVNTFISKIKKVSQQDENLH